MINHDLIKNTSKPEIVMQTKIFHIFAFIFAATEFLQKNFMIFISFQQCSVNKFPNQIHTQTIIFNLDQNETSNLDPRNKKTA
jgi:hypothetical protein